MLYTGGCSYYRPTGSAPGTAPPRAPRPAPAAANGRGGAVYTGRPAKTCTVRHRYPRVPNRWARSAALRREDLSPRDVLAPDTFDPRRTKGKWDDEVARPQARSGRRRRDGRAGLRSGHGGAG